ncbi:MAG: APC family permease [Planctomycetes bacterium]|nr:APC family permease [Planctomycetota bacterium]
MTETDAAAAPRGLAGLSTRNAVALVVANMIGAGVFTTSGYALADHSPAVVVLAWILGGVLATCGALSYGALGARFPHSGGEYELLRRTLHPTAGVLAGWVSLLAGFSAPIAFAAAALGRYLAPVLGFADAVAADVIGTVGILAMGALHLAGVRIGAKVQDVAVGVKLALIAAFVVGGGYVIATRPAPAPVEPAPEFSVAKLAVTCVWISFAYSGWNAAVYVAGEVEDARRRVPRSLLLGTLIVAVCYVAMNAVFVWSTGVDRLAGQAEVGLLAAQALFGEPAGVAVAGLVALALLTSISAMTMAGPRVYARMAEDGVFPRFFAAGAAHRPAVLLQMVLALAMLWTATFDALMTYIGYTLSLSAAATVVGLVVVRLREGPERVPVPGWPVVPVVFVAAVLAIAAFSYSQAPVPATWALGTLAAGALLHAVQRSRWR